MIKPAVTITLTFDTDHDAESFEAHLYELEVFSRQELERVDRCLHIHAPTLTIPAAANCVELALRFYRVPALAGEV